MVDWVTRANEAVNGSKIAACGVFFGFPIQFCAATRPKYNARPTSCPLCPTFCEICASENTSFDPSTPLSSFAVQMRIADCGFRIGQLRTTKVFLIISGACSFSGLPNFQMSAIRNHKSEIKFPCQ